MLSAVPHVASFVVPLVDKVPEDNDVKAGWLAFAIFIGLIVAVALLGYSLVKQLRKAQAAEDAGVYDPSDKKPRHQIPVETQKPADQG